MSKKKNRNTHILARMGVGVICIYVGGAFFTFQNVIF
jgi:hypothetical protein